MIRITTRGASEKRFYVHVTLVRLVIVYGLETRVDEKTRGEEVSGVGRNGANLVGQPKTKLVENCVIEEKRTVRVQV